MQPQVCLQVMRCYELNVSIKRLPPNLIFQTGVTLPVDELNSDIEKMSRHAPCFIKAVANKP